MPLDLSKVENLPHAYAEQQFPPLRPTWAQIVEESRRARFRELLESVPSEVVELVAALKAADAGDGEPMEAFVKKFVRGSLDPTLRSALEAWLRHEEWGRTARGRRLGGGPTKIPLFAVFRWAHYHRERLNTPPRQWYEDRAEEVYPKLRKKPEYELMRSLEAYAGEDGPEWLRRKRQLMQLKAELPGAMMMAEAAGHYVGVGGGMLRGAEKEVIDVNRLLRQTRKQFKDDGTKRDAFISSTRHEQEGEGSDLFTVLSGPGAKSLRTEGEKLVLLRSVSPDPLGLASYDGIEVEGMLDQLIKRGGLAPQELEVLALFRNGLTPEEIAAKRGTKPSTVYGQLRDIREKLRAVS